MSPIQMRHQPVLLLGDLVVLHLVVVTRPPLAAPAATHAPLLVGLASSLVASKKGLPRHCWQMPGAAVGRTGILCAAPL